MANSRSLKTTAMRQLLDELIMGSPKLEVRTRGVALYLVNCNPDLARKIIENANIDNRKIRQNKVAEFAEYMKRGDWMVKGTVEFLDNGRLHDGQHRLMACAISGHACDFICQVMPATSASKASQFTDIGVPRNLADYLHFNGVFDATRTAPFLVYERNFRISTFNPFQRCGGERTDYLATYHELGEEGVKAVYETVPAFLYRKMGLQRAVLDWFAHQAIQVDPEAAQLFLQYIATPEGLKASDPMFVLHGKLLELSGDRKQRKPAPPIEQATLFVKAWNLHYSNEHGSNAKIRYRPQEEFPHISGLKLKKSAA